MSFEDELEAFQAYARALPNNCVFLVDTYNSLEGVRKAVQVGRWLREQGQDLIGIRLDSGDFAYLSIEARKILDENGFAESKIVASNELDEHIIQSLRDQGAKIDIWGVGTKLVTAFDQPALGGVYKLCAVRDGAESAWRYTVKLSEQLAKITTPGIQQVRRFIDDSGLYVADMIFDEEMSSKSGPAIIVDPIDFTRRKTVRKGTRFTDMLVSIFRSGRLVYKSDNAHQIRAYSKKQLPNFMAVSADCSTPINIRWDWSKVCTI